MSKITVGIIGAGPAGLTLALLLERHGIECQVHESRSREHVVSRARAGLLEQNTVDLFKDLGVATRLQAEGLRHLGVYLSFNGERIRIPFDELTGGRCITIYGQQEVLKDLLAACEERSISVMFDSEVIKITNIETKSPIVSFHHNGIDKNLSFDFVAGCDGFHGISRRSLPSQLNIELIKDYPFSWLGILAHAKPSSHELIYAYHASGFALHSMRSESISRLYLQVDNQDRLEDWSDTRIWDELETRLHTTGFSVNRGEIFEKSITPMRSSMIDCLQHGRLFLAGDSAHIVPPTGGKGLNLAVADVRWLAEALHHFLQSKDESLLANYSRNALPRIWRAQDFSNFMTQLLHKQSPHGSFEYRLQKARFDYIKQSRAYATTIAENYVGLKEI